jgi:shikimate dehydrogenase
MTITGHTRVLALLGSPVTHSLSPQMHAGWIADHGLDAAYVALPLEAKGVEATVRALRGVGFHGANVTVPFKEAAARAADWHDQAVLDLGAANVLRWHEGELYAGNTDAPGFVAALNEQAPAWKEKVQRALVVGAGGAAKAIAYGLAKEGVAHIDIVNRSPARGAETATAVAPAAVAIAARSWDELEAAIAEADLIANATTLGMSGKDAFDWPLAGAKDTAIVADAVYAPPETHLLAKARARDLLTVDGLAMLIHQGALAFDRWFEITPDTAKARERLLAILAERA